MTEGIKAVLNVVAKVAYSIVNAVEACCNCIVEGISAISKSISLLVKLADKCLLVNSCSYICLCSTGGATARVTTAKTIVAEKKPRKDAVTAKTTKATKSTAKKCEKDEICEPITAPHSATIVVFVVATNGGEVSRRHTFCC